MRDEDARAARGWTSDAAKPLKKRAVGQNGYPLPSLTRIANRPTLADGATIRRNEAQKHETRHAPVCAASAQGTLPW